LVVESSGFIISLNFVYAPSLLIFFLKVPINLSTKHTMEITIDLTRDDYADFNEYYARKGENKLFLFAILAIIATTLFLNRGESFDLTKFIATFLFASILVVLIYFGILGLIKKTAKKMPLKNGYFLGKKKICITEEGLYSESEGANTLQKWNGIKSIEENENSIFLFVDSIAAYVIPKRFFKSEEEKQIFIKKIEEKVGIKTLAN